jgi:hypothetical protein
MWGLGFRDCEVWGQGLGFSTGEEVEETRSRLDTVTVGIGFSTGEEMEETRSRLDTAAHKGVDDERNSLRVGNTYKHDI